VLSIHCVDCSIAESLRGILVKYFHELTYSNLPFWTHFEFAKESALIQMQKNCFKFLKFSKNKILDMVHIEFLDNDQLLKEKYRYSMYIL
jgi:hypothetical protein